MQPVRLGAQGASLACAALFSALTLSLPAFSQGTLETPQQTNDRIRQLSTLAQSVQRDYLIGSGDLLTIEVFDVPELSREVRVSEGGTISLPLLPVRLQVAGLTELQLEQKITEVLEANGLVARPQVRVAVKERKSRPITVIGAVGHPLVYQAVRPVTLLEVLSEAGGIANDAGSSVIIRRAAPDPNRTPVSAVAPSVAGEAPGATPQPPAPGSGAPSVGEDSAGPKSPPADPGKTQPEQDASAPPDLSAVPMTVTINLTDLLDTGDPKFNIPLEGGDVVMVPRAGIVYVIGAVGRPGGFVLSSDREQMSTLKLLSLAGGLGRTARASQAVILRKDAAGQQAQVPVDLKRILQRKTEDVSLRPSDILFVPESGGKQAMIKVTEIALGVGTAAAIFRLGR